MKRRELAWFGAGAALAAFAVALLARGRAPALASDAAAAAAPPAPAGYRLAPDAPQWRWISVEPARTRGERLVAALPAQVALDEDHSVRVTSPVSGRLVRLDARPGERVAAGAPLAHLLSGDVGQAQSDLAKAEAASRQTGAALARARELYEHHVVALKDLQQAEADDAQARAETDRARGRAALYGTSHAVDQQFVLRAPIAGEVLERNANPGAEVAPGGDPPLFVLSDLRRVWITAALGTRDVPRVHVGDRARFATEALAGRVYEARVAWVSDALDPVTRTATIRLVVENADGALRAQMPGEVRLYAAGPDAGVEVPTAALVTHGNGTEVIVESGGRFAPRAVEVGEDDGQTATLLAGLRPGERVVTRGSLLLAGELDQDR